MALVDFAPVPRPSITGAARDLLNRAGASVVRSLAERRRRLALRDLLAMDSYRLDDLGISAFEVRQALERPASDRK